MFGVPCSCRCVADLTCHCSAVVLLVKNRLVVVAILRERARTALLASIRLGQDQVRAKTVSLAILAPIPPVLFHFLARAR
jgi:hypothetical protein